MTIKHRLLIILILFGFYSNVTYGLSLKRIALFSAGLASGVVFHEASHSLAIWGTGGYVTQFNFSSVYYNYPAGLSQEEFNSKKRIVSLAGYTGQGIASEIILQNDTWHENDFALGWMTLGILNNLMNPIQYYLYDVKEMDLGFYEDAGGNPLIPAIFMLAHSGYSIYRIFYKTDIPLYITHNTIGLKFKF